MTRQFKQIVFPRDPVPTVTDKEYSNNLLSTNMTVMAIAIYAQPGTRFQFNQLNDKGDNRSLVINSLGVFQMDVTERPITGLFINVQDSINNIGNQNIIIDLIYQEGVN